MKNVLLGFFYWCVGVGLVAYVTPYSKEVLSIGIGFVLIVGGAVLMADIQVEDKQ